ncbi:glycoside hydrolase family 88/105 protein [Brevundimonas sp. VNH65]|uniref:glycoside hydrolase family 88/105 protein n=1 Tax=Brevundimonas sp. VNH65 TaxID=3400917 RepID=UPI003C01C812
MRGVLVALASTGHLLALGACASSARPLSEGQAAASRQEVVEAAARVADWQLERLQAFDYVRTFQPQTADPLNWIQATLYAGLADFADAAGDSRYVDAIERHGVGQGWGFQGRPRHADADAIGHAWIWSARRHDGEARARRLAPIRARFQAVLAAPSNVELIFSERPGEAPCQARWCWSDAVFMAPPVWTALSQVTGDDRYAAHAKRELDATVAALFDREEKLFYRDSRFFDRRDAQGRKIFWSRGNGWAHAGLAKVIQTLPPGDPDRRRYEALFVEMSERIAALQGEAGYWPVSLLDPSGPPETSGTAFFVYGLAWGRNAGLLRGERFEAAATRGWRALDRAIQPDGRLGWVQQVGFAPDQVRADDTQLYGVGAYLMAASEMAQREDW